MVEKKNKFILRSIAGGMVAVAVTAGNPRAESGSHELAIRNIQETRQADFSLRACAEAGKAMCQAALALKFEACYGVSCDPGEAFQWMLKAAEQGFVPAQRSVGLSYFLGRGIGKDEQKAAQWINRAALQGDDEAALLYYQLMENQGGVLGC